jgi:hypothetical protein
MVLAEAGDGRTRPLPRVNLEQLNFSAVPRTKPSLTGFSDFVGNMYQPIEVSDPKPFVC